MKTRLLLLAVWLALPWVGLAADGDRLSASSTAGIADEKSSGAGSWIHTESFLLCDGQHRDNSAPRCYGGNALCVSNGFMRGTDGRLTAKACCTGSAAGTCAFDLDSTQFGVTLGRPQEVALSTSLGTGCTGVTTVQLQGAFDDNAPTNVYNHGTVQAIPTGGVGSQVVVTNAWPNRYVLATVSNPNNDCTDVEAILTLKWREER